MKRSTWTFCLFALAAALIMAALSPLASSRPDGLEKLAATYQHAPVAPESDAAAPEQSSIAGFSKTVIAILGTLAVFGLSIGLAKFVSARRSISTDKRP